MAGRRKIALLRGVNLAKRRRVAMADLRELLTGLGYEDVRTHLQSGNVVLTSGTTPARLEQELARAIADRFGFDVDVLVRTREQLARVVERNPLGDVADDPSRYLVWFLSSKPPAKVARELAALEVAPEAVVLDGRELYSWHPAGFMDSPLRKLLTDERLGVRSTNRNWNTVTKLLELASA